MESHKKVHLMNKTQLLQIFGFPALFTFDIAIECAIGTYTLNTAF